MWGYILIIIVVYILFLFSKNHINIFWRTFPKKGFAKKDDFFGLYTYTGAQGEGKTYSAVSSVIRLKLKFEYTIITNLKSFNPFPDTIYMEDIFDIIDFIEKKQKESGDFQRCQYLVFFDEIFSVIEKNKSNMEELRRLTLFLAQLRKRGIVFVSTAQVWSKIPKEYRDLCRFQVDCHMFNVPLFNKAFLTNSVNDGYNSRWDDSIQDFQAPRLALNVYKANQEIIDAYDTFEVINFHKSKREKRF